MNRTSRCSGTAPGTSSTRRTRGPTRDADRPRSRRGDPRPNFGTYNHATMAAFLEFCLARGCEVNELLFHALDDQPAQIAAIPANVRDAQVSFLENPRYAPLRIRRIIINEIVGPLYMHPRLARSPTMLPSKRVVPRLRPAPAGRKTSRRVSVTARSTACHSSAGHAEPRSVWWAHSLYAAGVPSRVAATASTANLVVLGNAGSAPAPPQVLIGHVNFQRTIDRQPATLVSQLTMNHVSALPAFASAPFAQVQIESIPNSGEAALAAPVPRAWYLGQDHQRCARHYLAGDAGRRGAAGDAAAARQRAARRARGLHRRCRRQRRVSPLVRASVGSFASGYVLEAGSAPDTANVLQEPLGAVNSFDASAPTGTYYVRMRSTNAYGAGAPTASLRVDAGCVTRPDRRLACRARWRARR